ncbi:MAG TPA: carboxypeptidase-like regulatory domain-containing protein, partial [Planctomycetota bacterium]|nr:carboxypeptidase-like regulatory domain-containing protein [Planctomycetota bacterium]
VPARGVPVAVRATGWSPWAGFTTVKAGATSEVAVALQPSASVTGVVRDEAGQVLADAHVSTEGGGQMTLQFDFSDDEGRFTLRDLPLGRTDLSANRDGVGRAATTLTVEPGGQYTWDPVLGAGLLIRGRVVDERGAALAGMGINAVPQEGDQSNHRTKTDAEGRFTLDNCADAPHRLEVDATAAAPRCFCRSRPRSARSTSGRRPRAERSDSARCRRAATPWRSRRRIGPGSAFRSSSS